MARSKRVVAVGCPHHITQRGNYRQDVFFSEQDRSVYLSLLAGYAAEHGLRVLGFCRMTNHIHRIAVPGRADYLADAARPRRLVFAVSARQMGQSAEAWLPALG
ncbi:MAG: transposase [Bryobacterales bacterium]|nr:transposase [Bryobacterales bacterium]